MNFRNSFTYITLILIALFSFKLAAQESPPLYIIFDGSNSMWGELPDKSRKIATAKEVFNKLDSEIFSGRDIALRLYGHRRASDCSDTELAVEFGDSELNLPLISQKINEVKPKGRTPISQSLNAALDDFAGRTGSILLISDGIETCDVDPCELVRSWKEKGVDIKIHVVGLGLDKISKNAMQCIAEASGTEYLDANSVEDLNRAIEVAAKSEPIEPGKANPKPADTGPEFRIKGEDSEGNYVPVEGTIIGELLPETRITSSARFVFEGGTYTIRVGIPTLNGELFNPIEQKIEIDKSGSTEVTVVLERPALVTTRFFQDDEIPGVLAHAYQSGVEIFSLRPNEEFFVMPGEYEFKAKLNKDNDLAISQTVKAGAAHTLEFFANETVRANFDVFPEGSNQRLKQHQHLFQDSELKYKVHWRNGADIRPGTYTVISEHPLTPYEVENVEIESGLNKQTINLNIPFAQLKATYQFKGEAPSTDLRCWLERLGDAGNVLQRSKTQTCNGNSIYLIEGKYKLKTWDRLGEFEQAEFAVKNGHTTELKIIEK